MAKKTGRVNKSKDSMPIPNKFFLGILLFILFVTFLTVFYLSQRFSYLRVAKESPPRSVRVDDILAGKDFAKPGDTVRSENIGAKVPDPGKEVGAEGIFEDGTTETLSVKTKKDGKVEVAQEKRERKSSLRPIVEPVEADLSACSDGAYKFTGSKWQQTFSWAFNSGTTPGNLSAANTITDLKSAAGNITGSRNTCALADTVYATQSYKGSTSRLANISSSATCGSGDGNSVVSFGSLGSSGYLAFTCWWSSGGGSTEADTKLNPSYKWFTGSDSNGGYAIQDVMTHEFGHVFGLAHPGVDHSNLTMYYQIKSGDISKRTLGLGDVRGLRALYPSVLATPTPYKDPTPTSSSNNPTPTPSSSDRTSPTVSITSPQSGTAINHGGTITIKATASDNIRVARVDFLDNGRVFCTDTTSTYSCSWKATGKPNTMHTISAKAYDAAGNSATSSIKINVGQ